MNHRLYQEWLHLSFHGELNADERNILRRHVASCAACRMEQTSLKAFHRSVAKRKPAFSVDRTLREARAELRVAIRHERTRRTWLQNAADAVAGLLSPPARLAVGGALTLILGFVLGTAAFPGDEAGSAIPLLTTSGEEAPAFERGEAEIINVRFVDRNAATGDVEFTFDAVTPVRVRGNIADERVQSVMARAIVDENNVGVRLRAVSMIAGQSDQRAVENDEVKLALITVLKFDDNLGVKKEALTALQRYLPDKEVTEAIIHILKHVNNTGLKIAAINSLDMSKLQGQPGTDDLLTVLREKTQSDENNYIRIRARMALQEVSP